jgi:hypothetical protein
MADKAVLIVACVRELGFDAEVANDILVYVSGPQLEAAEAAADRCHQQIDAAYADPPPLNHREYYDALLSAQECIRAQGIELPPPPTFDTWVEAGRRWSPHANIPDTVDFWEIHRICPQPGLGLTGSSTVP